MKYSSCLVESADAAAACDSIAKQICTELGGTPDVVFVFFSNLLNEFADQIADSLRTSLQPSVLVGCCGEGIVGKSKEVEHTEAISVLAGKGPAVFEASHLVYDRASSENSFAGWQCELSDPSWNDSQLILLADPFTFPAEVLLEEFAESHPNVEISGGMASGVAVPGDTRLILNDQVLSEGAIAVRIREMDCQNVVSQGCRPIGPPMIVTKAEANEIHELGGKPAVQQLRDLFIKLPTSDQSKVQSGLFIGRVVDEYLEEFEQGDFLIRSVNGIDEESNVIVVGDYIRVGATVRFQIRDENSATAEMQQLLKVSSKGNHDGGLIFACNGRGSNLFSIENHDATQIANALGKDFPIAGFFAGGEIGPVHNRNFLHGFTASVTLFGESTG